MYKYICKNVEKNRIFEKYLLKKIFIELSSVGSGGGMVDARTSL